MRLWTTNFMYWLRILCLSIAILSFGFTILDTPSAATEHFYQYSSGQIRSVRTQTEDSRIKIFSGERQEHPEYISTSNQSHRDSGEGEQLWSTTDENAISENIALSSDGRWVAIGYTLNDERLEVRDATNGQLQFSYPVESGGCYVAISGDGSLIAFTAMDSLWLFRRQNGAQPIMRIGFNGFYTGPVAISRDGRWVYCTDNDPQRQINHIWAFRDANPQPIWTAEVDATVAYGWYGLTLTSDGSILVGNGKYRLYVYNAQNGNLIWSEPTYNTESPTALSSDGSILATASLTGRLRVFVRDQQVGYRQIWHYNFTGAVANWVSCCAVSNSGNFIAAGTLDFYDDHYAGRVALFETYGRGQPLWISEPLSDEISKIEMSQNGEIIAAVSWGDLEQQQPDLVCFEQHNRIPFYSLTTPGSLDGLSMTQDGRRVVVGGKGVHNRQFGRGGQVYSINLTFHIGIITGTIRDNHNAPVPNAAISATQNPYIAYSDANGRYQLLIETLNQPSLDITARSRGFISATRRNVAAVRNQTTENIDFMLFPTDAPPQNLLASQGVRNVIQLEWNAYNLFENNNLVVLSALNDIKKTPFSEKDIFENLRRNHRDHPNEDADSIIIYRSFISGGPYVQVGSVPGNHTRWFDRTNIFPRFRYYYCITALFANGESRFSNEAVGWLDDNFLFTDANLESMPQPPTIDGRLMDNEWRGAITRDISDVFGYDEPDSAGSAQALIGFSDITKRLYLGFRYFTLDQLIERSGVGIYVDDDGNGSWSTQRPASEGNYWGYWRDNRPDLRYRSLTGAPYNADPYFQFGDSLLAFYDAGDYIEIEMALPLGFREPYEIALYAPHYTIGLGLFAVKRDQNNNPIFNGWWPQNMFSIVSNPEQFARITIPAHLLTPPVPPSEVTIERLGRHLAVSWTDPTRCIDSSALGHWQGVRIYRNSALVGQVAPGREFFEDANVEDLGWYEYTLAGYIIDDGVPFEGPKSQPVGCYAGCDPEVIEYAYDDGSAENLYVVSFSGEDNRFAVCFDIEADARDMAIWWVDFYSGGLQPIDIYIADNENGYPGRIIGRRLRAQPQDMNTFSRFHFPGLEQPAFLIEPGEWKQIWVVLNYLPDSPAGPAIGVDNSTRDSQRNMYYTAAGRWQGFGYGQLMIRAAVGIAPRNVPNNPNPIPTKFKVWANYPNPFNAMTIIPIELPLPSPLCVVIYDNCGRVVYSKIEPEFDAGHKKLLLKVDNLNSGSYIISIQSIFGQRKLKSVVIK